ncbi:hypothetical protein ACRAWD_06580 [Caulobacter segnis]
MRAWSRGGAVQAEAIARSTERCLTLGAPMVATIVGEGGSGGAIAPGRRQPRADPGALDLFGDLAGGGDAILWRGRRPDPDAATNMRITRPGP